MARFEAGPEAAPIEVKTAQPAEAERLIATVVLAFAADPVVRWSYPDSRQYLEYGPQFVRAFGGRAFDHGTAFHAADYAAVALWLPPGVAPDEEQFGALVEQSVAPELQEEAFALGEQMGNYHPKEPHWYLPLAGVDPVYQRRGLGSALLRHVLEQCDRDGLPAYLEATSPLNVRLYERHGFETIGVMQVGTSPALTAMLRKPRS